MLILIALALLFLSGDTLRTGKITFPAFKGFPGWPTWNRKK
jgi:hypothetical protein